MWCMQKQSTIKNAQFSFCCHVRLSVRDEIACRQNIYSKYIAASKIGASFKGRCLSLGRPRLELNQVALVNQFKNLNKQGGLLK